MGLCVSVWEREKEEGREAGREAKREREAEEERERERQRERDARTNRGFVEKSCIFTTQGLQCTQGRTQPL